MGSPPHMRGKGRCLWFCKLVLGITPAYAGKRKICLWPWATTQDHPRICGEKPHSVLVDPVCVGSPPHMRGKGRATTARVAHTGITPAYAGKSLLYHFFRDFARDHPRICGEKCRIIYVLVSKPGSPPHMRGKVCVASELARYSGITPAYAGKSQIASFGTTGKKDHPRICGEKRMCFSTNPQTRGSPPHMRGKDRNSRTSGQTHGITPAYAGKSLNS